MSTPDIHDILFDDENEDKLSKRGIYPEHVLDILSEPHIIVRNKRRRRGVYKLVRERTGWSALDDNLGGYENQGHLETGYGLAKFDGGDNAVRRDAIV